MKFICTLFLFLLSAATLAVAGPGHDHGHDHGVAPEAPGPTVPRLESAGGELELVATLVGHKLTIYLDRLATNEPVDGAGIEVSGDGIAGMTAKSSGAGVYEIDVPWADEPGSRPLIFTVTADGKMDLLNGVLEIPTPQATNAEGDASWIGFFTNPLTWVLLAIAVFFGFCLSFAFRPPRVLPDAEETETKDDSRPSDTQSPRALKQAGCLIIAAAIFAAALPVDGFAHSDGGHADEAPSSAVRYVDTPRRLPDGDVFVPKASQRLLHIRTAVAKPQTALKGRELIGTVVSEPSSFGQVQAPMDGRIELSDRGISHVGQRVSAGEVLALLAPTIPVADLGTMQQLTAEVQGKLRIAEQKLARLKRIEGGFVAQKDIEDTQAELEALREQKRVLEPKDAELIELKAPVSGVISVANVRAGQVVTTRDTLFEIVDPNRLWIEAISSSEHDTTDIAAAHATDADAHVIELSYIGRAPALRQQSLPLQFKVETPHEGLPIGSAVKVVVQHGEPMQGIILPDAAVVRGANGLQQVWRKVSAEKFEPLPVRTLPIDGSHVLVAAGVDAGSRIVTEGSELINQVR
jgi:cobalt-zinc-cadmium efflux system membrane fusion protein